MASGYIGMAVATYGNVRTTKAAMHPDERTAWQSAFNAAFRAGP